MNVFSMISASQTFTSGKTKLIDLFASDGDRLSSLPASQSDGQASTAPSAARERHGCSMAAR